LYRLLLSVLLLASTNVFALSNEQALSVSDGEAEERIAALGPLVASADPALPAFLQQLIDGNVRVADKRVYLVKDDTAITLEGQSTTLPESAQEPVINNRMRGELESALASMALLSPDLTQRKAAATQLAQELNAARLPLLEKAYANESDATLKHQLGQLRALLLIGANEKSSRLEAVRTLASSDSPKVKPILLERMAPGKETDEQVLAELRSALNTVNGKLAWGERLGVLFTGASLGSILLLVALGLAITYGLMGVINMAHGELMMIGAYATYWVQSLVRTHWAAGFDYYLWLAVPASFIAAALMGALLERTVIRHLYGRPLETLLATWGISLMLMQLVRSVFGAQNVQVENPKLLSGGIQVLSNLTLPYNRIAIIVFALMVLVVLTLLISRTRLGLFVRGVTQNRQMASCVGINTARIDTYAFSLGAGIAGLAGCALTQVGNVGPDLGQNYIVDAFMVVVLGGVGQLAGTVYAALGLGVINKLLEGWQGAVLAKIMVLVLIVLVIQKRPQGLFALKGRSAD
jgi:urea transport system permease protein